MHILKNHFEGKNTYIVGEWINNGCQTFLYTDLDKVCEKFNVSRAERQDVIDNYLVNRKDNDAMALLATHQRSMIRA